MVQKFWPGDNEAELIEFYGTPKSHELESQLVDVVPPFTMYYEGKPIHAIKFHKKAAPALKAALNEIWEALGKDQAKVDAARVSVYGGAYNPRYIRGTENTTKRWSNHAFAAAIDLDPEHNSFNTGHGKMHQVVIDAFKRQGARWGGDYHGRTDPMHFEFAGGGKIASHDEQVAKVEPKPAPPPQPKAPTSEDRLKMARAIIGFEARRDRQGHLAVYELPANDGGGRYEVAGINEKYNKAVVDQLVELIRASRFDDAERMAEEFVIANTMVATVMTRVPSIEYYLRDCIFNRGHAGATKICQIALGFEGSQIDPRGVDGVWGQKTETAMREAELKPREFLPKLRMARERYEREWVGYRANFWEGLVNRWNKALDVALTFPDQMVTAAVAAPTPAPTVQPRPADHGVTTQASAPTQEKPMWNIGSGLGALLKGLIGNKNFQSAAVSAISGIGQKGLELLRQGSHDKLKTMFENLGNNPQAVVGAITKGTEAEKLVDPQVVKAADQIKTG